MDRRRRHRGDRPGVQPYLQWRRDPDRSCAGLSRNACSGGLLLALSAGRVLPVRLLVSAARANASSSMVKKPRVRLRTTLDYLAALTDHWISVSNPPAPRNGGNSGAHKQANLKACFSWFIEECGDQSSASNGAIAEHAARRAALSRHAQDLQRNAFGHVEVRMSTPRPSTASQTYPTIG